MQLFTSHKLFESSWLLLVFLTRSVYEVWGYGKNLTDVKNRVCQYPENEIVKCQALMTANFFFSSKASDGNIFSWVDWIWYHILHAGLKWRAQSKIIINYLLLLASLLYKYGIILIYCPFLCVAWISVLYVYFSLLPAVTLLLKWFNIQNHCWIFQ